MKRLSDRLKREGCHTQLAIVKSVYTTLLPEGKAMNAGRTLQALYDELCTSPKYFDHSDRILQYVVDKLNLVLSTEEQECLKSLAEQQPEDILESRELKFIDLLLFAFSYETKETLVDAKILPESALSSRKDSGELISDLVQDGVLAPTTMRLNGLLKCVTNDVYKREIEKVLCYGEWTGTADPMIRAKMTAMPLKLPPESQVGTVELNSPQLMSRNTNLGRQPPPGSSSNWTAPVKGSFPSPGDQPHALAGESISPF